jgi:hypothetical protein
MTKEELQEIDAMITEGINLFHDALVQRDQIPHPPPAPDPIEAKPSANHCMAGCIA